LYIVFIYPHVLQNSKRLGHFKWSSNPLNVQTFLTKF
jgi:hypothetical protein